MVFCCVRFFLRQPLSPIHLAILFHEVPRDVLARVVKVIYHPDVQIDGSTILRRLS
jgi:hypothetical protein